MDDRVRQRHAIGRRRVEKKANTFNTPSAGMQFGISDI